MVANLKIAASLLALFAAGCSANARFDLSEFQPAEAPRQMSTASTTSPQPTYGTSQIETGSSFRSPASNTYGNTSGTYGTYGASRNSTASTYQSNTYATGTQPASLGWTANRPEIGTENTVHVVREGDTLWALSKRYNVPMTQLYAQNGLVNDRLTPGQHLVVPSKTATYDPTRVAGR